MSRGQDDLDFREPSLFRTKTVGGEEFLALCARQRDRQLKIFSAAVVKTGGGIWKVSYKLEKNEPE